MPLNKIQEAQIRCAIGDALYIIAADDPITRKYNLTPEDFTIVFNPESSSDDLGGLTMPPVTLRLEPAAKHLEKEHEFLQRRDEQIREAAARGYDLYIDTSLYGSRIFDIERVVDTFVDRLKPTLISALLGPRVQVGDKKEGGGYPEIGADSWLTLVKGLNRYALPKGSRINTALFEDKSLNR